MKPIWYLDVDGVINIVRPFPPVSVPEEHWREVKVTGFPIRYDQRVVDFINRMHREDKVEIVWLTTWERRASEELAPALGLDEFRLPSTSLSLHKEGAYGWWKWESIKHHNAEDQLNHRAVIWTDDDLTYSMKLQEQGQGSRGPNEILRWVARRELSLKQPTLGISPRPSTGLTMAHLDSIVAFVDSQGVQLSHWSSWMPHG